MVYFASYFALVFALGAFVGFAFGYFYRGRSNARSVKKGTTAKTKTPAVAPPPASDELMALPGMVAGTAAALTGAGVASLDDLRGLTGDRLAEVAGQLKLEDFALRRWVGLADLQSLPSVDADLAQALVRIGVRDGAGLAGENADRVQNKLTALNEAEGLPARVPGRADVVALIEAAGAR